MRQAERRHRQHRYSLFADQERILVRSMHRAAIFEDAHAAGNDAVLQAMVQQHHAIGNVFLDAVARERAFAALAGDHGGDALVFEPAEQAPQLRAQDAFIVQAAEERLGRVQHHALRADRIDGAADADKQALEIVFTGFGDLALIDVDVIDNQFFRSFQSS